MNVYFITFRSVTPAQRGEGLLRMNGIHSRIQRTPRWMEEKGCGYCLRLGGENPEKAVKLLRQNQISFRKVYLQHGDGNVEEVGG